MLELSSLGRHFVLEGLNLVLERDKGGGHRLDIGAVRRDGFLYAVCHIETTLGGRIILDALDGTSEE